MKFDLMQAFMHVLGLCKSEEVLVFCKNEEDPIKNEGARVFTTFLPL